MRRDLNYDDTIQAEKPLTSCVHWAAEHVAWRSLCIRMRMLELMQVIQIPMQSQTRLPEWRSET